jgi:hypothetical protein
MASDQGPKLSAGAEAAPKPKIIDNPPASTVGGALANSKKQVDQAK